VENKWRTFKNSHYRLLNLGRPAVFLLPIKKLQTRIGKKAKADLHVFLIENFTAYTITAYSIGVWKDSGGSPVQDKCQMYEVSFTGRNRIPMLLQKLAKLAKILNEECIYFKAGQYSCLVYPKK
jgi:hypothetical protein